MSQINKMIEALKDADDAYFNTHNPIITDAEYDKLYRVAKKTIPHHEYFTGIGSEVRGGKIDLPYQMGSLNQVYEGEIGDWVKKHSLEQYACILSEKLDGTSAMVVYNESGELQIAYSRGDGIQGADITRHIKNIPSIPNKVSGPTVVRGEVIISKKNFPTLQANFGRHTTGESYKNARNAIAGIMNRKENPAGVYEYVDFIAYEIIKHDGNSKTAMLADLRDDKFLTPATNWLEGQSMDDATLSVVLDRMRTDSKYEIDGLVIDVDLAAKRDQMNPTKDTLNPEYAIKYKIADDSNYAEAKVVDIELNVSKHGYIKPVIVIEPTELVGVTITRCTGFNMRFIKDKMIQPGCVIKLQRSGDVIPFCMGVATPGTIEDLTN